MPRQNFLASQLLTLLTAAFRFVFVFTVMAATDSVQTTSTISMQVQCLSVCLSVLCLSVLCALSVMQESNCIVALVNSLSSSNSC